MKSKKYNLSRLLAVSCLWLTALTTGVSILAQPSYAQTTSPESSPEPQPGGENPTQPQTEVSQEELQQFAQAYKQIQQIRQDSEVKMVEAVQNEGLSPERFIEISELQQSPQAPQGQEDGQSQQAPQNTEITAQEQQGFENAKTKILEIRQQSESQMEQAIQAEGLDVPRFNEIVAALQQDPALRDQVQQMILN
ncbi:DUF4168 domain-containing protein [Pleurocapsales cyanobacterium LEGE 06147]|nr:DUF4168 domain-containing protein [Pleurocapsales cyanobacterium LEGE 06147]